MVKPNYIKLYASGELNTIINKFEEIYNTCTICPHQCNVNRFQDSSGFCKTASLPFISSYNAHFGEEPPLVGYHGSGTIFFSNCNMGCKFCQNYEISQLGYGQEISYNELADIMLSLQYKGCHNINFVTPSHQVLAILKALEVAIEKGLRIPLVYNTGGYDNVKTLRMLEGIIDIYMPDIKYFNNEKAYEYSGIKKYAKIVKEAIIEMYRQVGDLIIDNNGIAQKGLLIRHLILPNKQADSYEVLDFISNVSKDTYINVMDQYRPEFKAHSIPQLKRRINGDEYSEIINYGLKIGLKRIEQLL